MRTRFFTLRSGALTFSAGVLTVNFPIKTRNNARCAIIGIGYDANDPQDSLMVAITSFVVGSRQYVQGDNGGVILGLLAQGAEPAGTSSQNAFASNPYFPCSGQLGEGGNGIPLPGGGMAGGILLQGGEQITISLAEIEAGANPINQLVLYCVQFDDAPADSLRRQGKLSPEQLELESWWERFVKGIGQIYFHGSTAAHGSAVILNTQIQQRLRPPFNRRVRRLEIRGEKTTTTAVAEDNFADDFAIVSADTQNAHMPSSNPAPCRTVFGHAHLRYSAALVVDIELGGQTLIDYSGPAPGADMVVRLTGIYEGQDESLPALCGPTAF